MATPAEPPAADAPGEFWAGEDEIFELADEYESGSGLEYNRWVQTALNRVMGLHLAVDGIVGPKTRSAIRSFQQKQGLRVDGIVGPITESALIRAAGLPPGAVASPSPYVPAPAIPGGGAKPTGSPVAGGRVTSPFGYRTHPLSGERKLHQGIDIGGLPVGTQVNATAGGQVVFAGNSGCAGNMVKIAHGNGYLTKYFHLNSISVSAGQTVSRGQKVGGLGQTGCVTGPHLHYEVHRNGVATDPAPFINP
jgi:murein DD-endopeptidase MepM/ murein hydrolase activator NlpD